MLKFVVLVKSPKASMGAVAKQRVAQVETFFSSPFAKTTNLFLDDRMIPPRNFFSSVLLAWFPLESQL